METETSPKKKSTLLTTLWYGLALIAIILAIYSTTQTQNVLQSCNEQYQHYIDTQCLCQDRTPTPQIPLTPWSYNDTQNKR